MLESKARAPSPPLLVESQASQSVVYVRTSQPFAAVIAIGILIKGEIMHFEYISVVVSHGLMRVRPGTGVPAVFGVLTALTETQGFVRAGTSRVGYRGHNRGEDASLRT